MKINGKHEVLAQVARRGLQLVALLAMVLSVASVSVAQSTAASAQDAKIAATPAAASQSSTTTAKSATSAAKAPELAQEKPPVKGAQEGIKVHGHWTIEVRNPNGSLDKHVEFENGLCLSSGGGIGNSGITGGDAVLAGLLASVIVPGGWEIILGSPALPNGTAPGPACSFTPVFYLLQTNSAITGQCASVSAPCFTTLGAPTLNLPSGAGNVITLTGQFTVPSGTANTQITAVGTGIVICSASLNTATQCLTQVGGAPGINLLNFTGTYLTGVAPIPPAPTVSANQVVSVTVQISFQ